VEQPSSRLNRVMRFHRRASQIQRNCAGDESTTPHLCAFRLRDDKIRLGWSGNSTKKVIQSNSDKPVTFRRITKKDQMT
jgi:hypothetical protein